MTTPRPGIALFLTEIMVADWHGSVRWYVETLGLRLVLEDAPHRYALLDAAPGRVALKAGAPAGLSRDVVRLVFEVADIDIEHDRLARLDMVVSAPEDSPEGYRAIRLRDPEGTPITLFSWKSSEGLASSGA